MVEVAAVLARVAVLVGRQRGHLPVQAPCVLCAWVRSHCGPSTRPVHSLVNLQFQCAITYFCLQLPLACLQRSPELAAIPIA